MDSQTLIREIRALELWPDDVAQAQAVDQAAAPADARALAKDLLKHNLLTPYQANQLLTGNGKTLAVGPYRLQQRLGEGATALVFKAHHHRHHRIVALKVVRPEWVVSNPAALDRFFREAQAAAALSHPNVVRAYDVGQDGEFYYFAMQFLDGTDLARLVEKEGPLEPRRACGYILQAALGLQHIHEHGMIHRDVKPGNLMITPVRDAAPGGAGAAADDQPHHREQVKILDLGLARLNEDPGAPNQQAVLTRLGTVMGTPDYMAPEQALHSRNADARSDIYSLGCTLYFGLAGKPPFAGGDAVEKMLKHQLDEPPPIGSMRPDLPPGLQQCIERMMAKKPELRYQSAAEAARALEAVIAPPVATPPARDLPELPVAQPIAAPVVAVPAAGDIPPLMVSPLVRVPSAGADWGLWVFLACVGIAAIACLIVAVVIVLR